LIKNPLKQTVGVFTFGFCKDLCALPHKKTGLEAGLSVRREALFG
jgi:hypothetical protein